jgi:hypothetical protein
MYSITFNSSSGDEATSVTMNSNFLEQPTWMELSDKFMNFLKANGYVFDINEQLRTVADNTTIGEEFKDYETTREPKRKAPKKASKKV